MANVRSLNHRLFVFAAVGITVGMLTVPPTNYALEENEVLGRGAAVVLVREHPQNGKPYVAIVPADVKEPKNPLAALKKGKRPDYRMLDPHVKSGEIPYEGPSSDRTKVYVLAAGLATAGAAGGVLSAGAPAAASGAGGGAGFLTGALGVVTASGAAAAYATNDSDSDDFTHTSSSRRIALA